MVDLGRPWSTMVVLWAPSGFFPPPPRRVPCRALRGCRSCVLSRRGSRSCAPGLRPRRPLLTYVVGVAVPAALLQLRPRRLCYIGTWAPKALRLVVVWVTSGEERLRSLGVMTQVAECLALVPKRPLERRRSICFSLVQGVKRVAEAESLGIAEAWCVIPEGGWRLEANLWPCAPRGAAAACPLF